MGSLGVSDDAGIPVFGIGKVGTAIPQKHCPQWSRKPEIWIDVGVQRRGGNASLSSHRCRKGNHRGIVRSIVRFGKENFESSPRRLAEDGFAKAEVATDSTADTNQGGAESLCGEK